MKTHKTEDILWLGRYCRHWTLCQNYTRNDFVSIYWFWWAIKTQHLVVLHG